MTSRARAAGRAGGRQVCRAIAVAVGLALLLAGCAGQQPGSTRAEPLVGGFRSAGGRQPPAGPTTIPEAQVGLPAKSTRIRFIPESLSLPGGARAKVLPAQTVNGELKVPEHVRNVGWWDGSSYAGDPFGSTVIAGHVDSATEGIGFFARLLRVKVGDRVTLRGDGHHAAYRIVSVQTVAKRALASDSKAFDQTGDHRLVLITCAGNYNRSRGGYDSNLVVIGKPIGLAR